jgi:hypothetical protein
MRQSARLRRFSPRAGNGDPDGASPAMSGGDFNRNYSRSGARKRSG